MISPMKKTETLFRRSDQEALEAGRIISQAIQTEIRKVIRGSEHQHLIDVLIMALFADGHVLAEAPVGTAKTLTCSALARAIRCVFRKQQIRPDMLPSDLAGWMFYNQKTQEFEVQHGPFHGANLVLIDEVNRGTPKTMAALLEIMEERCVTIRGVTYPLEPLLMVLATQNPIEHEGTYDLPEAQLDRFLARHTFHNLSRETLIEILSDPDYHRSPGYLLQRIQPVTTPDEIIAVREAILANTYIEPRLIEYIAELCHATWEHNLVAYGVSPRGAKLLEKTAAIAAFMAGPRLTSDGTLGYYVTPEDVQEYAFDVLPHRIFMKPEARYDRDPMSPEDVVKKILDVIKPPV